MQNANGRNGHIIEVTGHEVVNGKTQKIKAPPSPARVRAGRIGTVTAGILSAGLLGAIAEASAMRLGVPNPNNIISPGVNGAIAGPFIMGAGLGLNKLDVEEAKKLKTLACGTVLGSATGYVVGRLGTSYDMLNGAFFGLSATVSTLFTPMKRFLPAPRENGGMGF